MYRSTDSYLDDEEIIISVPLPVSYEKLRASVLFRQAHFFCERYGVRFSGGTWILLSTCLVSDV